MGAPALLEAQAHAVLARLNAMTKWQRNHVVGGGVPSDGGQTQGSGANTAPNIDIDTTQIDAAYVGGSAFALIGAGTDIDSDAGDQVSTSTSNAHGVSNAWGATSGVASWATVCLIEAGTFVIVMGRVAATASAVVTPWEDIAAYLDTEDFAIVADVLMTRTGDTTITFGTPSYARRTLDYSGDLSVTEAEFRETE